MDIYELFEKWTVESKQSIDDLGSDAPPGVVTREYMRFLVLQWTLEIDKAKAETK